MNKHTLPILLLCALGTTAVEAETLASFDFNTDLVSSDTSTYSNTSDFVTAGDAFKGLTQAVLEAPTTVNTSDPTNATNSIHYMSFDFTVQNLAVGETLDLTQLSFDYGTDTFQGYIGVYTDAVGYTGTGDKIGAANALSTTTALSLVNVDLTASNGVVGSSLTGLTNGDTIEFLFIYGDNYQGGGYHRLDNVTLIGNTVAVPEPGTFALLSGASAFLWIAVRRRRS